MVNTIFSSEGSKWLDSPVRESVPLVAQRIDSVETRDQTYSVDCDDDARSSQGRSPNLNTRNYDSSSLSQVSVQKSPAQKPLIFDCWRKRDKQSTGSLP